MLLWANKIFYERKAIVSLFKVLLIAGLGLFVSISTTLGMLQQPSAGIVSLASRDGYLTLKKRIESIFDRAVNSILQKKNWIWEHFLWELSQEPLACLESSWGAISDEKKRLWIEYIEEEHRVCSTKKDIVAIAEVGSFRQKVLEKFLRIFVSTFPGSSGSQVGSIIVRSGGGTAMLSKPDGHRRADESLMPEPFQRPKRVRLKESLPEAARGCRRALEQDFFDKDR